MVLRSGVVEVVPSTWGRGEGGSRTLAVLLWPALPTCSTPTVMTSCSEPSTFLSLGLVVVVVVAAVVEVAVVAVVAVVAMEVVLEEVLEEGEVMVLELGMGSVLVSRAMVVAVRGALVSRTEEREVGIDRFSTLDLGLPPVSLEVDPRGP